RAAQRRLDGLSRQARHLLVTATVLGPSFRLEDAAEMLGETPAALLPTVEEAMDAGILAVADNAFSYRHQLLRRAVGEMIPGPARKALHRQYGQILLGRGEPAALAAGHLLHAARLRSRHPPLRWPPRTRRRRRPCFRLRKQQPSWRCVRWS